jgi:ribonuclease-3
MAQHDFPEAAKQLQKRIGYTFQDADLLKTALTHPSLYNEKKLELENNQRLEFLGDSVLDLLELENNQRLEFLGDSVLDLILAEKLYIIYPRKREGFLMKCRSILARGETLTEIARKLQLQEIILLDPLRVSEIDSSLADALESLMGAIFLDSDYPTARAVIFKWFKKSLCNLESKIATDNPKGNLQEAVHGLNNEKIEYRVLDSEGPAHKKKFKIAVFIGGKRKGTGTGNSKKKAGEMAAERALRRFK